jgi:hypothetical protein
MQRYSRDRDRDDAGGRDERGSHARSEDRYSQGRQHDRRDEFGGQRGPGYEGSSSYDSAYGTNPGPGRWREASADHDRFAETYGRGGRGEPGDDHAGGPMYRGGRGDDDRGSWNTSGRGAAWQPGSRRAQYGETEYGGYGPRYGSGYSGGTVHGSGYGTYGGGSQSGNYGVERGDDRYGRQGYGQSGWQQDHEGGQHRFDPDYQQWREEQIRNLDEDYRTYRQERYKKFSAEFDSWRKNRASTSSRQGGHTGFDQPGGGPSGTETVTADTSTAGHDPLGASKSTK